jgi:hypothetical protein
VPPLLLLAVIPPQLTGRVMAVFSPLQQLAGIVSMALAGVLVSTLLRGMHVVIAGAVFGPVTTIFGLSGLLIVAAGVVVIASISRVSGAHASAGTACELPEMREVPAG